MKYALIILGLLLTLNITAQELPKKSKIFVRVYNSKKQKIIQGKILKITDTTLVLRKGRKSIWVPLTKIAFLKTKRGPGHNAFLGGIAGAAFILSVGGTAGGGGLAVAGMIVGVPIVMGTSFGIGYLTYILKNSEKYIINGNPVKWSGFKEDMYHLE